MELQPQQPQQQQVHRSILDGIDYFREEDDEVGIVIDPQYEEPIDGHSWQHLVHFLREPTRAHRPVMELALNNIELPDPSDGGLDVLRSFFTRSDTTLTKVMLRNWDCDTIQDSLQLIAAFQTNRTVTDLTMHRIDNLRIDNLRGAALGNSLSGLLQNMPQLQRLDCAHNNLDGENGVRAFQPGLRNNQTIKELNLHDCMIGDKGIRLLADALAGNTTMEVLILSSNLITSKGLDDITQLIRSTQLKVVNLEGNDGLLKDRVSVRSFVMKIAKNTAVQELPGIIERTRPALIGLHNVCARNKCLHHVDLLLAPLLLPPPRLEQQQQLSSGRSTTTATTITTMWIKTCHKAITEFAMVPNNSGASAIFKLFQARPQLLEKRLKQPKRKSCTVPSVVPTEQKALKKKTRHSAITHADAIEATSLPTQPPPESVETSTTTTTTPTATSLRISLFQEAKLFNETLADHCHVMIMNKLRY